MPVSIGKHNCMLHFAAQTAALFTRSFVGRDPAMMRRPARYTHFIRLMAVLVVFVSAELAIVADPFRNDPVTAGQPDGTMVRQPYLDACALYSRQPRGPINVLRLVIEYKDGAFYLNKAIPLKMILPPSDPESQDPTGQPLSGFWIELHSSTNEVIYRRIMSDPLVQYTETIDPVTGDLRRFEYVPQHTYFSILVPDLAAGTHVLFFSSAVGNLANRATQTADDISRAKTKGAQLIGSVSLAKSP